MRSQPAKFKDIGKCTAELLMITEMFSSLFRGDSQMPNVAKFGWVIEQSSRRNKITLVFRYLTPFRNENGSKSRSLSVVESRGQIPHFLILPVKIREGVGREYAEWEIQVYPSTELDVHI